MSDNTLRVERVTNYQRHPGSAWINSHRSSLKENHWVAANAAGLVAEDMTMEGLMGKLGKRHVNLNDVAIAFITSESA